MPENNDIRGRYKYDAFISFADQDKEWVRKLYDELCAYGLRVFSWTADRSCERFPVRIEQGLNLSRDLILCVSEPSSRSEWVKTECETFLNRWHMKDPAERIIHILMTPGAKDEHVPTLLSTLPRRGSVDELTVEFIKSTLERVGSSLDRIDARLGQVRQYYKRRRFWDPVVGGTGTHVFTCGRGVPRDPLRGGGGRTNIDMWDYQTVLDITHFLASRYRRTDVKIEDPEGKITNEDLGIGDSEKGVEEKSTKKNGGAGLASLAMRLNRLEKMLADKNCIIVGSPDVSDFSELVLAKLHGIDPYQQARVKQKGFVIIKEKHKTRGTFYWEARGKEKEGVAQILGPGDYRYFDHEPANKVGDTGVMHGILVVAENPFQGTWLEPHRTVILSGFSGIATNAMAKLLTDEEHLDEFYVLDDKLTDLKKNYEILVRVEYTLESDAENRDTRKITRISAEEIVVL